MVKMRQRHLCVFEFEKGSFDEILAYIQYNADFMRDRLLAFHDDITPEIREFLCTLGAMPFKVENKKILQSGKVKQLILSLIHISEPTRHCSSSRMPSSA